MAGLEHQWALCLMREIHRGLVRQRHAVAATRKRQLARAWRTLIDESDRSRSPSGTEEVDVFYPAALPLSTRPGIAPSESFRYAHLPRPVCLCKTPGVA
jgi:hypothetical protein